MMQIGLIMCEQELERYKQLMDASVMIDVLVSLLISKGIATADEIAGATAQMRASEKYDFEVKEAEADIKVFRQMMKMGAEMSARESGALNADGTWNL